MPKTYQETRGRIATSTTNDKGEVEKKFQVLPESRITAIAEEAKKASQPEPELLKVQTFTFNEATSIADISELVPNEAEALNLFNRGYVLKQQSIARDLLDDDDFAGVEGPYDLRADAAEVRERKKATPQEKALKQLMALSADDMAAVLAQFQASQAAAS